jgi:hypothetical protein
MCFKHLPIEFDAEGNARLKEGLTDPWGVRRNADRYAEQGHPRVPARPALARNQRVVTHMVGSHAFRFVVNHDAARRASAR